MFAECWRSGARQRLFLNFKKKNLCRVPAIWHSAKKQNITSAWPFSFSHSLTLPVPSLLPVVDAPRRARQPAVPSPSPPRPCLPAHRDLPRVTPSSGRRACASLPHPRSPAAPTLPPRPHHRRSTPPPRPGLNRRPHASPSTVVAW
jgi:hypothetical protein